MAARSRTPVTAGPNAGVIGLGRIVGAAQGVASAFGYDIDAALEDPQDH
jgi:hypothetical protein